MNKKKDIIIIGSGVAGLATSVRLANAGHQVHVFEANSFPGGKINSKQLGEYRFDQGPSILTGIEYIKELYDLCGEDFSEFEFADLTTSFNYFFNDGVRLNLSSDPKQIVEELSSKLSENKRVLRSHLRKMDGNYRAIAPLFIEKSLHKWRSLIGASLFKALIRLPKYKLSKTMHEQNAKRFDNPRTVQIFDRFASYNGSHPYQAPAMLNMISHLEINVTPFLPKKGMIQITDAIYALALKQGVKFHFNEKINSILTENGTVTGVKSDIGSYSADEVISNMDVTTTYEQLLSQEKQPTKILEQEKSSSALVFYWGINKSFPELTVHNSFFTDDTKAEFDGIFEDKVICDDPTIYVNITSKSVKGDAPEGCENWFVMVNSPIDVGQDWDSEIQRLRKIMLQKLSNVLGEDIESLIEEEDILEPRIISKRYQGKSGSIYGNASNNKFAAFYRHANFSKEIDGLYFVGVSVHPGGGIPLALNSAKIASDLILKK